MNPCACGKPQQADYYLDGVLGRGNERTGTETEELSQFACATHATRKTVSAALKERDREDPEGLAQFGSWKILEFRKLKLKREVTHGR